MNIKHFTAVIFLSLVLFSSLFAQSTKKYLKSAAKFTEAKNYEDAIQSYTKAIGLDPGMADAYEGRAHAYESIKKYEEAAKDYERAYALNPKNPDLYYNAGRIYVSMKEYKKAVEILSDMINKNDKYVPAYHQKTIALMELNDLEQAEKICEKAILQDKKDAMSYYYYGLVLESKGKLESAKDAYVVAIGLKQKEKPFYIHLAEVQRQLGGYGQSMFDNYNKAIYLDQKDPEPFTLRGKAYYEKGKLDDANNDFTKSILLNPDYKEAYYNRGLVYIKLGQFQNAIGDFSKAISIDKSYPDAYFGRATAYEQVSQNDKAVYDYEKVLLLAQSNDKIPFKTIEEAKKKKHVLGVESDKPQIIFEYPKLDNENRLEIPDHLTDIIMKGKIKDASRIKDISVEGRQAIFSKDSINPSFSAEVLLPKSKKTIIVEATDDYDNKVKINYVVNRTEINPPKITLLAPYASDNGDVYLDTDTRELYIEGKIDDQSYITSISVGGASAAFSFNELNPTFTSKIDLTNKASFIITAIDAYGNKIEKEYTVKRENVEDNPMGITWVVFIENSNYKNMGNLQGPEEDVRTMKAALSDYNISNIIHKEDMTKRDLEQFFSIELRDVVKANRVKSLLIWYAGHGKFINETGYWIPVDAQKDVEFSYYNVNTLRASLQSYKDIVHFLVVSDACETGPAFLLAMRGSSDKSCDNWQATKLRSAQAFTSAGFELASDVSVFTKTFAKTLKYNTDKCLPIEKVVQTVTQAVKQNQMQAPRFGKIDGINDENGTFFFIRK